MKKTKKCKKTIIIAICLLLILSVVYIYYFFMVKNMKIGNNKSSQEMVDNILNMKSYEALIEVCVNSNKNQNKYLIRQKYNEKETYQEVLEPSNIKGVKIIKTEGNLKLENSKLNLTSIFENYNCLSENNLDLDCFVNDYKNSNNSKYREENEKIIMETNSNNNPKINKILYINIKTGKPEKLEIVDTNKKNTVYILYKEVDVNSK